MFLPVWASVSLTKKSCDICIYTIILNNYNSATRYKHIALFQKHSISAAVVAAGVEYSVLPHIILHTRHI